jgi:predicted nucleic acid-binding Zn ribbon protein
MIIECENCGHKFRAEEEMLHWCGDSVHVNCPECSAYTNVCEYKRNW